LGINDAEELEIEELVVIVVPKEVIDDEDGGVEKVKMPVVLEVIEVADDEEESELNELVGTDVLEVVKAEEDGDEEREVEELPVFKLLEVVKDDDDPF